MAIAGEDCNLITELFGDKEVSVIRRNYEMSGLFACGLESRDKVQATVRADGKGQQLFGGAAIAGIEKTPGCVEGELSGAVVRDIATRHHGGGISHDT